MNFFSWLSRLFTIPKATRDKLNAIPEVHDAAAAIVQLAISVAQNAVATIVTDPNESALAQSEIANAIHNAIPTPAAPAPAPTVTVTTTPQDLSQTVPEVAAP
jgi:hypothetical protein